MRNGSGATPPHENDSPGLVLTLEPDSGGFESRLK